MRTILETTEDGSHTLCVPEMEEHYHSTHGAIQESMHVFIDAGLLPLRRHRRETGQRTTSISGSGKETVLFANDH